MSVYVADFTSVTEWQILHDDAPGGGHGGTVDPATVKHTTNIDGSTENHNFLIIQCPVCDSVSTHPVGGGAQPQSVQQMFVNKTSSDGCPCGNVQAGDTSATPEAHVRLNCNRMDGIGRWQLETAAQIESRAAAPNMFQVVYRNADRLILGLEPSGGVGPNNRVAVIHDMAEYDVLMATNPAYLSASGDTIQGTPP